MNNRLASIIYPEKLDEHMIVVKKRDDAVFDDNYKYIKTGFLHRVLSRVLWLFQVTIGYAILFLIIGARVKGRKNLRLNKAMLKNGAVSVCNHVHFYDAIIVANALGHPSYYPVWDQNCRGPNRFLIFKTGGIPVPNDIKGLRAMNQAFDTLLSQSKRLHFFPEGSMWWYFKPLRPFRKGAFTYAVRHNVPIIPLAFSYREPTGLYKLFGRRDPLLTLNIGEPFMPPSVGDFRSRVDKMRVDAERECAKIANTVRFAELSEEEQEAYKNPNGLSREVDIAPATSEEVADSADNAAVETPSTQSQDSEEVADNTDSAAVETPSTQSQDSEEH